MTNPFIQYEVAPANSCSQFNAFDCGSQQTYREYPVVMQDARAVSNYALMQYDSAQGQPFEITDTSGRVLASSCPPGGCSPCSEYSARGWNRRGPARGGCDSGDYDQGDQGGDCGPGGGCGSGRGGLMRGLLGRFGRGGLMSRLFGGGGCSGGCGGCLGFARGFRR